MHWRGALSPIGRKEALRSDKQLGSTFLRICLESLVRVFLESSCSETSFFLLGDAASELAGDSTLCCLGWRSGSDSSSSKTFFSPRHSWPIALPVAARDSKNVLVNAAILAKELKFMFNTHTYTHKVAGWYFMCCLT